MRVDTFSSGRAHSLGFIGMIEHLKQRLRRGRIVAARHEMAVDPLANNLRVAADIGDDDG